MTQCTNTSNLMSAAISQKMTFIVVFYFLCVLLFYIDSERLCQTVIAVLGSVLSLLILNMIITGFVFYKKRKFLQGTV